MQQGCILCLHNQQFNTLCTIKTYWFSFLICIKSSFTLSLLKHKSRRWFTDSELQYTPASIHPSSQHPHSCTVKGAAAHLPRHITASVLLKNVLLYSHQTEMPTNVHLKLMAFSHLKMCSFCLNIRVFLDLSPPLALLLLLLLMMMMIMQLFLTFYYYYFYAYAYRI